MRAGARGAERGGRRCGGIRQWNCCVAPECIVMVYVIGFRQLGQIVMMLDLVIYSLAMCF